VHALPALIALATAALLGAPLRTALVDGGHLQSNYRQRQLPFPFGLLIVASALGALIPLTLISQLADVRVFYPQLPMIAIYTLGVSMLGLIDDSFSDTARGWRGHGRRVLRGGFSTGALKAAGSLGLALYVMSEQHLSTPRFLLATGVLVLATNLLNLLDLRPGRSTKALVLLGAGLSIGSQSLKAAWALGLFAAPALIAGLDDLRERAMLGDTGANLLGALAGLWMVLTLSGLGQLIALILLAAITIYGEFRSISEFVERTPGLRELDSWGRPT
jgi:UDP-N-acetylmuramyl pentapeptide phosphotransferase/UDP-N-acetylglucosamine-1-phosphate transferase